CYVGAESEPTVYPCHGCGVHEVAPFPVGTDVRQEGTNAVQDSHQVDVENPTPGIERNVVDAAAGGDPGIVADYMHISERLVCRFRRAFDADGIGNVTNNAAYARLKFVQALDGG